MGRLRIGRILAFLVPTFALSWGFHIALDLTLGHERYLALGMAPLDMLVPAFVAIVLRVFVCREDAIHIRRYRSKRMWILIAFLLLSLAVGTVTVVGLAVGVASAVVPGVANLLTTAWTLLVLMLLTQSSRDDANALRWRARRSAARRYRYRRSVGSWRCRLLCPAGGPELAHRLGQVPGSI